MRAFAPTSLAVYVRCDGGTFLDCFRAGDLRWNDDNRWEAQVAIDSRTVTEKLVVGTHFHRLLSLLNFWGR